VTLRLKKRGILQLTHATNGKAAATVEVTATETGNIPAVALDSANLATALEIAPTLWLTNSMSPVVARRADGVFCVVMPMRLRGAAEPSPDTKALRRPSAKNCSVPSPIHAVSKGPDLRLSFLTLRAHRRPPTRPEAHPAPGSSKVG
jgi:hypothetical protein